MRLLLSVVFAALAGCSAADAGGIPGSGSGSSRSYPVADFTSVELRGSDDVAVRVGGGFSVTAEGDPKLLDELVIEKRGDTLRIGRRSGIQWSGGRAKVTVTMPAIRGASLAGAADLSVDRVKGGRFDASLGGSGNLRIGAIEADEARFSLAGSGDIAAAGTARTASFSVAGSGNVAAKGLRTADADVSIAGSGRVTATVDGTAKVSILGSGDVDLGPGARCTVSKLGSGKVRCGA